MKEKFISRFAASLVPYTAGEQPKDKSYVKLNTNENAYPPSPNIKRAIGQFNAQTLKLYPDPASADLRAALAKYEGVKAENIFVGNGSDEVLALCFPAFFDRESADICFADITYSFYAVFCSFFGINYRTVALGEDFALNLDDYKNLPNCQGILIANPNAPTGRIVPCIEELVSSCPDKLIIIDEAYIDFSGQGAAALTQDYDNLLVVKTFSKGFSLAGIRCGWAVGNKNLISALERCRDCFNSYPIDRLCQAVCCAALEDIKYYKKINGAIIKSRGKLAEGLKAAGFRVIPSDANFIFAAHEKGGKYIYEELKKRGVLVRFFDRDKIRDFVRITVGTDAENAVLLEKLGQIQL